MALSWLMLFALLQHPEHGETESVGITTTAPYAVSTAALDSRVANCEAWIRVLDKRTTKSTQSWEWLLSLLMNSSGPAGVGWAGYLAYRLSQLKKSSAGVVPTSMTNIRPPGT